MSQYLYMAPPNGIPKRRSVYKWNVCLYRETQEFGNMSRKAWEYIDSERWLRARYCVEGYRESVATNASVPTDQFQSLRVLLSIIAYRNGIS